VGADKVGPLCFCAENEAQHAAHSNDIKLNMDKRIWINPLGNFGNRALQYLAAEGIRQFIPGATIRNVRLPEVGIFEPGKMPIGEDSILVGYPHQRLDSKGLAERLNDGSKSAIILSCFAQHIDNYPPRELARSLIPHSPAVDEVQRFGRNILLCSIRSSEILTVGHPDYVPLPPSYYKMLAERTGLELVFFGQIPDEPYCNNLREAFPNQQFIAGKCPAYDFEVLRGSVNIAPSISTFAWLAAWLSNAEQVFLPVCGLYNHGNSPEQEFLPLSDASYRYVLFPATHSVNIQVDPKRFWLMQDNLARGARWITAEELSEINARRSYFVSNYRAGTLHNDSISSKRVPLKRRIGNSFEERMPYVIHAFEKGFYKTARLLKHSGLLVSSEQLIMNRANYLLDYPDAAIAISEGYFLDTYDHYCRVGRSLGYRRI